MLHIDFTKEEVCGERGPNLYWYGSTGDFYKMACILQPLGERDGHLICLPCKKDDINSKIELTSKKNGSILNKYNNKNNTIIVELDCEIWREILLNFFYFL